MAEKKILALIPARSGSKSVVNKNIRKINGKPMMAYSIEHAKASKYINRIIVSTDSEEYAQIAREYGAETPFIRPAEYATDTALDIDVFAHALSFLKEKEDYVPDIIVQLIDEHICGGFLRCLHDDFALLYKGLQRGSGRDPRLRQLTGWNFKAGA